MTGAKQIAAVGYLRMSSAKQDTSIPAQKAEVEKYARANGFKILRFYQDAGISGSESTLREGFKQLMRDAVDQNDFQVILCWDQDRFSRFDPMEANFYWYQLREAGVRIVTVRQGELDLSELAGWLTASINQHGKAQYLKDLSANVLRGRLRKAELGLWVGSRAPYGYAVDAEGHLELGPADQVRAVKFIFNEYTSKDTSLRQIAMLLNDRGVPSPSGQTWIGSTVQCILRREAYASGKAAQLRECKGKFNTTRGSSVVPTKRGGEKCVKPVDEWFHVDCPKLVDASTWKRAMAKLKERRGRTTPRRGGGPGLFSGILHCAHCGARMMVNGKPLDSSGDVVYCCSTYNVKGTAGCHRNLFHQAALVPYLIERIQERVLGPANFDRLRAEVRRQAVAARDQRPADLKRMKAQLSRLDAEIKAATAQMLRTPDDLYDLAVAALRELREKRAALAADLASREASSGDRRAEAAPEVERAIGRIQQLSEAIRAADPAVAREALREIVERVDLWFDHRTHKKITRSHFSRGVVQFRDVAELSGLASRPG